MYVGTWYLCFYLELETHYYLLVGARWKLHSQPHKPTNQLLKQHAEIAIPPILMRPTVTSTLLIRKHVNAVAAAVAAAPALDAVAVAAAAAEASAGCGCGCGCICGRGQEGKSI